MCNSRGKMNLQTPPECPGENCWKRDARKVVYSLCSASQAFVVSIHCLIHTLPQCWLIFCRQGKNEKSRNHPIKKWPRCICVACKGMWKRWWCFGFAKDWPHVSVVNWWCASWRQRRGDSGKPSRARSRWYWRQISTACLKQWNSCSKAFPQVVSKKYCSVGSKRASSNAGPRYVSVNFLSFVVEKGGNGKQRCILAEPFSNLDPQQTFARAPILHRTSVSIVLATKWVPMTRCHCSNTRACSHSKLSMALRFFLLQDHHCQVKFLLTVPILKLQRRSQSFLLSVGLSRNK